MAEKDEGLDPRLADLVAPYLKAQEKDKTIYPDAIATQVMNDLDRRKTVERDYPKIYFAAHSALKQTARAMLRRKYPRGGDDVGKPQRQARLPGMEKLQRRYPQAHQPGMDHGYILREEMSEADWLWNLAQFDKDITGRQTHRAQFKLWGIKKGWSDPDAKSAETAPESIG